MAKIIREVLSLDVGVNLKSHRTYRIWYSMRQRCSYKKHQAWDRYGGRGIKVDPAWESFITFLNDMGHPPTDKHTIDRIDNDLGYCKSNCQWVTKAVQNKNKSNLIQIETPTGVRNLLELCLQRGMPYAAVWHRIQKAGWSVEDALNKPIRSKKHA